MAYKIQYTPENDRRYPQPKKCRPVHWQRWVFAAAIFAGIVWLRWKGVPDFMIPGDADVTVAAAKNMVDNLRQGQTVNDAVSVFCKEILHGAGF